MEETAHPITGRVIPEVIDLSATYSRPDGLWGLTMTDVVRVLPFEARGEPALIHVPPGVVAGNHRHEKTEAFVGVGEGWVFVWRDETSKLHEEPMNPDGELKVIVVPAGVAHAVVNEGDSMGILWEFDSGEEGEVIRDLVVNG